MILPDWEALPKKMQSENVRKYYIKLERKKGSLFLKRCFDFLVALIILIITSPVLLILALLIKVDSKGPVFYRQERVTCGNKIFKIFKFRTMIQDADKIGALVTTQQDPRITKVGNKIRKCRLDELPQLFNIIKGDMSFVGTRPEVRKYVDKYTDEMMATLLLPAGVTSLASIKYKDEDEIISKYEAEDENIDDIYIKRVLPEKMKYNLEYLKNFSFWGDISLMFKTFIGVLK